MFLLITFSVVAWIECCYGVTFTAVGNVIQNDIFPCGEKITLMCTADKVLSMEFIHNGITVASCSGPTCGVDPNFVQNFTYDITSGTFNFTFNSVQLSDDKRISTCKINGQPYYFTSKVTELPENGSLSINQKNMSNEIELQAITGCVFPVENITFEWYTVKVTDATVIKPYFANNNKTELNNSLCQLSPKCQGSTGLSNSFVIPRLTHGEDVFMEVRVIHQYLSGRQIAVKRSSEPILLPDTTAPTTEKVVPVAVEVLAPTCFELIWCIILVVLVVISFVISLVIIIIWSLVRGKNKVDDRPDMPTDFKLVPGSITEKSATFSLISGNNPAGKHTCVLCYKPFNSETTTREKLKVMANEITQKTIDNLEPGCKYRCYVYAKNSKGASNNTDHIDFVTLGRPDKPTKFKITLVTENSLLLCWKPGLYSKYDQSFILKYTNKKTDKIETVDIPGKTVKHLLTPLAEGTKYELVLYAKNKYGESDGAGPLIQTTKGLPETPTDVQLVSFDEKTITIEWKSGKYRKYQQTFVICFRLKSPRGIPWKNETAKDQDDELLQHTVINLKEGSTYELKIFAWNKLGYSDPSETLIIETKGKPESPSDLRVVERRSKSITIGWKPGEYRRDTQNFVVNFRRVGREGKVNKWKQKEVVDDGITSSFEFNIGDLVANKLYHISINSTNLIGSSTMSDVLTVRTNPLLPQPPTEFMCQNVSEYTAQVSWKPKYYKQTKQSFLLRWAKLTDKTQISKIIKFNNKSKTVDYNIADLSPGTDYELCVWSFFEDLEDRRISESCKVLEITTKETTADENDE